MPVLEQRRAHTVTKLAAGEVTTAEAALLLGLSERSIWRLKRRRSRWPKRRTGTARSSTVAHRPPRSPLRSPAVAVTVAVKRPLGGRSGCRVSSF